MRTPGSSSRMCMKELNPRVRIFLFLSVCLFSLFSCKKKEEDDKTPVACISIGSRFAEPEQTTQFNNCSTDDERSEWNFGDGTSSTLTEPSHKWENAGVFETVLTVHNGSKSAKTSKTMYVGQKGHIILTVLISKWKAAPGEMGFTWASRVHRASDKSYLNVMYYSAPGQFAEDMTGGTGDMIVKEDGKLFLRVHFNGGSLSDSLQIDNIHVIEGVSVPTGSASLKSCDVSYTVSTALTP
jgi:PKD repeat protein